MTLAYRRFLKVLAESRQEAREVEDRPTLVDDLGPLILSSLCEAPAREMREPHGSED